MLYYLIGLHLLWGLYAAARTTTLHGNVSAKQVIVAFLINTVLAPISMVVGTIAEAEDVPSILEVFNKS